MGLRKYNGISITLPIPSADIIFILLHNLSIVNLIFSSLVVSITYDDLPAATMLENEIVSVVGLLYSIAVWYYLANRSIASDRSKFLTDMHGTGEVPLALLFSWLIRICFAAYLVISYSVVDNTQFHSKTTILLAGIFQCVTLLFSLAITPMISSVSTSAIKTSVEDGGTKHVINRLIKPYSHKRQRLNLLPVAQKPRVGRFKR